MLSRYYQYTNLIIREFQIQKIFYSIHLNNQFTHRLSHSMNKIKELFQLFPKQPFLCVHQLNLIYLIS